MNTLQLFTLLSLIAIGFAYQTTPCGDTRLMKCSAVYKDDVCGFTALNHHSQIKENYLNHCLACVLGKAEFTVSGKCEDIEQGLYVCSPKDKQNNVCTLEYEGVCGYFNETINCIKAPCGKVYSSKCTACSDPSVASVKSGECLSS